MWRRNGVVAMTAAVVCGVCYTFNQYIVRCGSLTPPVIALPVEHMAGWVSISCYMTQSITVVKLFINKHAEHTLIFGWTVFKEGTK